jgi:hypothetical protein
MILGRWTLIALQLCTLAGKNRPPPAAPPLFSGPAAGALAPGGVGRAGEGPSALPQLNRLQLRQLAAWYAGVGEREAADSFGDVVVRAATAQLGKPYDSSPPHLHVERLQSRFDSFECLTLVESSLALARCVWRGTRQTECFLRGLEALRYRQGVVDGYASRLHYFEDWLGDNAQRGLVKVISADLGGVFVSHPFFFMTKHPARYPALSDAATRTAILQAESRLAHTPMAVIPRELLKDVQATLHNGDIVGITSQTPGIFVRHTGFVSRSPDGVTHLLHASSLRGRVMLTREDLADYVLGQKDRRGVIVARPVPPM